MRGWFARSHLSRCTKCGRMYRHLHLVVQWRNVDGAWHTSDRLCYKCGFYFFREWKKVLLDLPS